MFTDKNMMDAIKSKYKSSQVVEMDQKIFDLFKINHSPCKISYNINGFKFKNMDKISPDIEDIYIKLF